MGKYIPIDQMTPDERAAKRAKINARNASNVAKDAELTAKRRLKKKIYK